MPKTISVLGSGSWATAIVKILEENKLLTRIHWWMRKQEYVENFEEYGNNLNYLSSVFFDKNKVAPNSNLKEVVEASDIIVLAVPSAFVHRTLKELPENIFENKIIVTAVKGLIPENLQVVSDYFKTEYNIPSENIACVGGPCHAEEVAREKLSYLTIASESSELANEVMSYFACRFVKCSISSDITGIEFSAVLKNIYAIAAGIANGLGYGDNFKAVLISASIREIENFLEHLNIEQLNVNKSAYLGDLLVTGYSQFSRNRSFGNMLGRGYSVETAHLEMKMIAEGYYSAKQVFQLNKELGASLPIMEAVYKIIYENKSAWTEFKSLASKLD